ncbi:hypothetical protein ACFVS2_25130 [Brevibacillus sp. NPDC058079]|uniref:hypothetical protein n=1 Tax=Brevibacillus sp. NPDC058079 TaxID=3346330 RepID=UPI0036ECDE5B
MWGSQTPSVCNCDQCNETPEEFAEGYLNYLYEEYKVKTNSPLSFSEWIETLK